MRHDVPTRNGIVLSATFTLVDPASTPDYEQHLVELGRIAIAAQAVQTVAIRIVRRIISHDDEVAKYLTAGWTFARACDVMVRLIEERNGPGLYSFLVPYSRDWRSYARDAMRDRNRYIHGYWSMPPLPGASAAVADDDRGEPKHVTLDELRDVTRRLNIARGNGFVMYLHVAQAVAWDLGLKEIYEFPALGGFVDGSAGSWQPPADWASPSEGRVVTPWIRRQERGL